MECYLGVDLVRDSSGKREMEKMPCFVKQLLHNSYVDLMLKAENRG